MVEHVQTEAGRLPPSLCAALNASSRTRHFPPVLQTSDFTKEQARQESRASS